MWVKFKSWLKEAWFTPIPENYEALENVTLDPIKLESAVDLARVMHPADPDEVWDKSEFKQSPRRKKANKKKKTTGKKKNQKRKSK